jgi:alkylated DNA repair protein (DNA oxidative demethylase)
MDFVPFSLFPRVRTGVQMPEQSPLPSGLVYQPDLITKAEEQQALGVLEAMEFHTITMHGQTARRTVRHFGLDYGYESWKLVATDPLPDDLAWLQERAAGLAGLDPGGFAQILVSRYPPGSTIGWHRDAPTFGAKVVGISLAASCRMRFQRGKGPARQVAEVTLDPRSGYVLSGAARFAWQHSIPPTKALRYSITFRTLKAS